MKKMRNMSSDTEPTPPTPTSIITGVDNGTPDEMKGQYNILLKRVISFNQYYADKKNVEVAQELGRRRAITNPQERHATLFASLNEAFDAVNDTKMHSGKYTVFEIYEEPNIEQRDRSATTMDGIECIMQSNQKEYRNEQIE